MLSISRRRLTDDVSLAKTDRFEWETTRRIRRASRMVVRSNDTFDPKFLRAAVRSRLDKIWRRCFEERIVEVCYRGLNVHTVRGRPTLKYNIECFHNGLVRELKVKQRKLSRHSKTMDLIDVMTNRNVRSVRVKSIRV